MLREIESGTFRLAWTQGRTRWQWLVGKLAVVGTNERRRYGLVELDVHVVVDPYQPCRSEPFLARALSASSVLRRWATRRLLSRSVCWPAPLFVALFRRWRPRSLPSLAVRVAASFLVRPHFATPVRLVMALKRASGVAISKGPSGLNVVTNAPRLPNVWVTSVVLVNKAGKQPSGNLLQRLCPQLVNTININSRINANPPSGSGGKRAIPAPADAQNVFSTCVAKVGSIFHQVVSYQPANRYWPFQFAETGLFIVAALVAISISYWWIHHRLA